MSDVSKGRRNEAKTAKFLTDAGFVVETAKRSRFAGTDFFGLFDHICVASCDIPRYCAKQGETIYAQTKSNRLPERKYREEMAKFPAKNSLIFVWYDRVKVPRILRHDSNQGDWVEINNT